MCGIVGYIGKSKNQKATFDLVNQLMIKTEIRGDHATGFWACMSDENKVIYHKEPVKSSVFVHNKLWQNLEEANPNLLIGHCRWTTPGGGSEKINKNNHPHVSKDYRVALVHNGKIPEYNHLKKKYETTTDCDSEILLRIFESAEDHHDQIAFLRKQLPKVFEDTSDGLLYRIFGLSRIFSEVSYGAMAVAIGERLEANNRALFLFRNDHRPMTLIDLRASLGQIFFCSTPELFRQAVDSSEIAQKIIPANQSVVPELPDNEIFSFLYNPEDEKEFEMLRFKVNRLHRYGCWETDKDKQKEEDPPKSEKKIERVSLDVVSNLDSDEDVISSGTSVSTSNSTILLPVPVSDTMHKFPKHSGGTYPPFVIGDDYEGESSDQESDVDGSSSTLRREKSVSTNVLNNGFQEIKTDKKVVRYGPSEDYTEDFNDGVATPEMCEEFDQLCKQATEIIERIQVTLYNKFQEGSITKENIDDVSDDIRETIRQLESTDFTLSK